MSWRWDMYYVDGPVYLACCDGCGQELVVPNASDEGRGWLTSRAWEFAETRTVESANGNTIVDPWHACPRCPDAAAAFRLGQAVVPRRRTEIR